MPRFPRIIYLIFSLTLICSTFTFVSAQDDKDVEVVTEAVVLPVTKSSGSGAEEDEEKVTGATLRGRIIYEDSGRPVGQYIVRVIEPVSHAVQKADYDFNYGARGKSTILRTYFPEGENSKNAKLLDVERGQEQAEININLPDRKLFSISGRVVLKKKPAAVKGFRR